jgi:hypothetical protein
MTTVFVVLGEQGEYSDRSVWVSGVYATRGDAESAMVAAMARRREYDLWSQARGRHWQQLNGRGLFGWKFPLTPEDAAEHQSISDEADRRAGPKPAYEPAERVELFELPMGQWHSSHLAEISTMNHEVP